MKIGFIGLGNMGKPMAVNLLNAGYEVTGFDIAQENSDLIPIATTAIEAARGSDVVITMLPDGIKLQAVAKEVLEVMPKESIFLDCSTVDVQSARAIASESLALNVVPLDAPVSGGVSGATAGTLTFMVGGSNQGFEKAKPLFEVMGQKAVYCGPSGNGQTAKICNNMILGATMIVTCEAFAMADRLGLDRQSLFDVVSTSSGYSWSMNAYCPASGIGPQSPSDNNYKPGFASELMVKDLRLSQQAAKMVDADCPIGRTALKIYEKFVFEEDGKGKDFSAILPRFERSKQT